MKFLIKIEEVLNTILLSMGSLLISLIKKLIPKKVSRWRDQLILKIEQAIESLRERRVKIQATVIQEGQNLKMKTQEKVKELKAIPWKAEIQKVKTDIKETLNQSSKKESALKILTILFSPLKMISSKFPRISAQALILFFVFVGVFYFGTIVVLREVSKIQNKTASREPASIQVEEIQVPARPKYYQAEKKQLTFSHMEFPLFVEDVKSIFRLHLEFVITFSNRTSMEIIKKREFDSRLKDHLINSFEPVIPSFPLSEEGKEMLKNKIQEEVDIFLLNQNIPGAVEDVRLISVLAY